MPIDKSLLKPYPWWEEHKKISNYHFKPSPVPEENIYNTLCTFTGDWTSGIETAIGECYENYIELNADDENLSSGYKAAESDMQKLTGANRISLNWLTDIYNGMYDDSLTIHPEFRCENKNYEPFYAMAEKLGYVEVHDLRVTFQRITQVCTYHLDLNESYKKNNNLSKRYNQVAADNHLKLRRTFIALTPYELGQIWYFGDQYWKNYRAGEAVTFDWKNMPHGTANLGFSLRCNLQITGFVGDQFDWLVKNGSKDYIIDLG